MFKKPATGLPKDEFVKVATPAKISPEAGAEFGVNLKDAKEPTSVYVVPFQYDGGLTPLKSAKPAGFSSRLATQRLHNVIHRNIAH
jgi:hypothetical protein